MNLFIDSSAFIALSIKSEQNNLRAKAFLNDLNSQVRLVTSNFILDETLSHFISRLGAETAYKFGDQILQNPSYEILDIDKAIFHEALKLLRKFHDKRLSFTDLTSFAIMRMYNIKKAFSFDRDFIQVGFETVPY